MRSPDAPATLRTFIGLRLPRQLATPLSPLAGLHANADPQIRWTSPENLHVTLKFLGSTQRSQIQLISTRLRQIHPPCFRVHLADVGVFERAGVLIIEVEPSSELLALQSLVEESLEAVGFPREERPYRPHITLARRSRRSHGGKLLSELAGSLQKLLVPARPISFQVSEFIFYESAGGHYREIDSFPLQPNPKREPGG